MTMSRDNFERRLRRLEDRVAPSLAFSDDDIVRALEDGTATPAHLDALYPVVAEDLVNALFRFGSNVHTEGVPAGQLSMLRHCPMFTALGVLSYQADGELPTWLMEARTRGWVYDPATWEKQAKRLKNGAAGRRLRHLDFVSWAKAALLNHALPTPDADRARRILDDWNNGGPAPVDIDRTPSARAVRLLAPLDFAFQLPLLMLRVRRGPGDSLLIRECPPIPSSRNLK